MFYYKIYNKDKIPNYYCQTTIQIAPEQLCAKLGLLDYIVVPISKWYYDEMASLVKPNDWDLEPDEYLSLCTKIVDLHC